MKIIHLILILLTMVFLNSTVSVDSEYIERREIPKDIEYNFIEIHNYKEYPMIFFYVSDQKGVIYLGETNDIAHIYNINELDIVITKEKYRNGKNYHNTINPKTVPLENSDNEVNIINENTIQIVLERFKFIISTQLEIQPEEIGDNQFFILSQITDIEKYQESFSVEQIFIINNQYPPEHHPIVSVIPENFYIEFICDKASYEFQYKKY